ncbi:hypothetical protein T12_16197 [Trichinella patagoniensis]|uniref:Uncharacterized protein n=1 Tax=Trichinella patagoniensis TaxID=990121 RepID=A0A0V0ZGN4_9BILA|nr:hypothetical protein T12_16197 [Trichinella patagoniensis]
MKQIKMHWKNEMELNDEKVPIQGSRMLFHVIDIYEFSLYEIYKQLNLHCEHTISDEAVDTGQFNCRENRKFCFTENVHCFSERLSCSDKDNSWVL